MTETTTRPAPALIGRLLALAPTGLAAGYLPGTGEFAQTVRGVAGPDGVTVRAEGVNLRYAAMAVLGLHRVAEETQRATLAGRTAAQVCAGLVDRAVADDDAGAVALVAWAQAEVLGSADPRLLDRLRAMLAAGPLPAVAVAWAAVAAVEADGYADTGDLLDTAVGLLLAHQGRQGLFPHVLPPQQQPRWRAHVGSFADQVYPLQALARASALRERPDWLGAAELTAQRLVDLQGPQGQWWWHYDARTGAVVERYPVYSVHQHAMAPMVLRDLREAGGRDHTAAVELGLGWLERHPEVVEELVADRWGLVWRKVGRREPPKAARALGAAATAIHPSLRLPGLDTVLPPGVVDHECRPYELGWLLYAWSERGGRRG